MFTKQVSPPADGLDPPIVDAEVEQVERTRGSTWSRARSEVSMPFNVTRALHAIPFDIPSSLTASRSRGLQYAGRRMPPNLGPLAACALFGTDETLDVRSSALREGGPAKRYAATLGAWGYRRST
jgi:hypothetical protein